MGRNRVDAASPTAGAAGIRCTPRRTCLFAPALALLLAGQLTAHAAADSGSAAQAPAVAGGAASAFPLDVPSATTPMPMPAGRVLNGSTGPRPRIGLVLGGGGAKGAAHVGVLRVLDEMRIPIDCIAGTSMGALVGGTYAAGMSAAELEQTVLKISWKNAIAFEGQRAGEPMHRKLSGVTYSNRLEFGLKDGRLTPPAALIESQNIDQTIAMLVARSQGITDFDHLPIPFRAVATDMQKGEMAVLERGSLAGAMRASMSVPGVFAPVQVDERLLGDGGLTRNLPVDVARGACADVVIAVIVPTPPPTLAELQSPLTMAARTLDIMITANERQQIDSLGSGDVLITVPMGEIGASSFEKVADAIPLGRAAALEHRSELERYSLPQKDYEAWRAAVTRGEPGSVTLASVRIDGAVRVNPDFVRETLRLEPGDEVTNKSIANHVNDVFALGDFDTVRYELSGPPDASTLDVTVTEHQIGANQVRFDIGMYMGSDTNAAFTIGADYLRTWINSRGGEFHGAVSLGYTTGLGLSVYQPLDEAHRWFVEPGVKAQRTIQGIYVDGDSVADYSFNAAWGFVDAGRVFGTNAELRGGLRSGGQSVKREIALPTLGQLDWEGYGGTSWRYTYDDRDSDYLARSGMLARVEYFQSVDWLGAAADYQRLDGMIAYAVPVGSSVAQVRVAGGSSLGSTMPDYDLFQLGGPVSFPGFAIGELRGDGYWTLSTTYLKRIAEISDLFGQALYVGATLTAGAMDGQFDYPRAGVLYSGALLLGGRTPLGPVTLSVAGTSQGDWQLSFDLGRPIQEHAITDPVR
jgi:NTE family protein